MTTTPTAGEPSFPLQEFLEFTMGSDEPGTATASLTVADQHVNPYGNVHGAVLFALVDTTMGKATMSVLDEGSYCASIEVALRFIRPATRGASLRTTVRVVRRGRHVVHLDAEVHDSRPAPGPEDDRRLVATAAGTFAVIAPD